MVAGTAVDVPFANPFTQIIHLSISYLYEVRIFYFADVDMGSSEVLADLPQVTVGTAKAGREVCLMPKSLFFALPIVFISEQFRARNDFLAQMSITFLFSF